MSKKWYSYFVVTDPVAPPATADAPVAAPRAEDLAPAPPPVDLPEGATLVPASADLALVYEAARITAPAHGYTVLKVAEMLQSEHIRSLPADVRARSVRVALDAAGVTVADIVEDAVRRDRALDTYERLLQQHADDLAKTTATENRALEDEIAARVAELRARIDGNVRTLAAEQAELEAWRTRKQQEEALIAEAVSHFVSDNPITMAPQAAAPQGDADVR